MILKGTLQQNIKEASDSILSLENTLENKLSEIELFRKKVEEFEEANSNSCEKCENPNKTKYGSEMHDLEQDSLPSTSKCGTYVSDDENDMRVSNMWMRCMSFLVNCVTSNRNTNVI